MPVVTEEQPTPARRRGRYPKEFGTDGFDQCTAVGLDFNGQAIYSTSSFGGVFSIATGSLPHATPGMAYGPVTL